MDRSPNPSSGATAPGGARGFVAARRRRRQQLEVAPTLRWERAVAEAGSEDRLADGTPVWSLALRNDGGSATEARVVLFTTEAVVRDEIGDGGRIGPGEHWSMKVDRTGADPAGILRGYALARAGDGRWHAATVDGREASFRTEPDELGVLRTLGLRLALGAAPREDGLLYSAPATADAASAHVAD